MELVNRLDRVTNLHVHGLHVSSEGNGDNVFVAVEPGRALIEDIEKNGVATTEEEAQQRPVPDFEANP